MEKSIFQSKTFWTNIVALCVSLTMAFGIDLGLDTEAQTAIVGGILSVVNIALRFVTTQPVSLTGSDV